MLAKTFYSKTFVLWPLCKYFQDEDKYLKEFYQWLLGDVGK